MYRFFHFSTYQDFHPPAKVSDPSMVERPFNDRSTELGLGRTTHLDGGMEPGEVAKGFQEVAGRLSEGEQG